MDFIQTFAQNFDNELHYLEEAMHDALDHDIKIIKDILERVVSAGGKRIRPILLMASTALVGGEELEESAKMGVAIELIHTATLLHDDVVDENHLRRGTETANHTWGNSYAILSGDYLFTKAFHLLVQSKNIDILDVASKAAMEIASGEVLQMINIKNFQIQPQVSIQIIKAKTAQLISAACRIGAIIGQGSQEEQKALGEYGEHLGVLFQVVDDLLDYIGDTLILGKPIGSDFWEGKITLPLLYALENSPPERHKDLKKLMEGQDRSKFDEVKQFVIDHHGVAKSMEFAREVQQKAIQSLSIFQDSKTRKLLEDLTHYCLVRVA